MEKIEKMLVEKPEDGFAGIKKSKTVKTLNVVPEKPKLVRHKYKCDIGKKSYTFQTKKELCDGIGLSNKAANKLLKGEVESDKIKIHTI